VIQDVSRCIKSSTSGSAKKTTKTRMRPNLEIVKKQKVSVLDDLNDHIYSGLIIFSLKYKRLKRISEVRQARRNERIVMYGVRSQSIMRRKKILNRKGEVKYKGVAHRSELENQIPKRLKKMKRRIPYPLKKRPTPGQ